MNCRSALAPSKSTVSAAAPMNSDALTAPTHAADRVPGRVDHPVPGQMVLDDRNPQRRHGVGASTGSGAVRLPPERMAGSSTYSPPKSMR